MKSWLLERRGRESLHLVDLSEPKPGPEQILVRVKAVSLNYRDKLMIEDIFERGDTGNPWWSTSGRACRICPAL
jgi:NADPH:quinone reductase-like Zn-dependent oxidoreductase